MIEGYGGQASAILALERGEVEGTCFTLEAFERSRPDWISSGRVRVLFNVEREPVARLNAPSVYDLAETDEQRGVLDFLSSAVELGRPVAAPPGTPPDRVAALRRAFEATMQDADFLADAQRLGMTVSLRTGNELLAIIGKVMQTSPDIVAKAQQIGEH